MISGFKFTVDGKDFSRNIKSGVQAMMAKAVYASLSEKLGSLIFDIEKENGTIEFNQNTGKISISGCSQELINTIEKKLS